MILRSDDKPVRKDHDACKHRTVYEGGRRVAMLLRFGQIGRFAAHLKAQEMGDKVPVADSLNVVVNQAPHTVIFKIA
jgi:hypothetical protein